jgi:tetratricopeptide (TPR) repeat protein
MKWLSGRSLKLILLLAPLGLAGFLAGRHFWAEHHFSAAESAIQRRDFSAAEEHLHHCLAVWPKRPDLYLLLAQCARRSNGFDQAGEYLADYERLGGSARSATLERLLARAQQGDLPASVEAPLVVGVRQGVPETSLILEALTRGYLFSYRLGPALDSVQRLLRREPDHVQALVWRGWVREGMHNFPQAEDDYRQALALDPDHFEARLRLAEVLLSRKRPGEAKDHFERLLETRPEHVAARLGLARCLRQLRQPGLARRLLTDLRAEPSAASAILRELGKVAQDQKDLAEAEDWFRKAFAADPHDQENSYTLAQCLFRRRKKAEGTRYLNLSKRQEADLKRLWELNQKAGNAGRDPSFHMEAATICLRNGQPREAVRWLSGALQIAPGHKPAHRLLADSYEKMGNAKLAAQHRRIAGEATSLERGRTKTRQEKKKSPQNQSSEDGQ